MGGERDTEGQVAQRGDRLVDLADLLVARELDLPLEHCCVGCVADRHKGGGDVQTPWRASRRLAALIRSSFTQSSVTAVISSAAQVA